MDWVSVILFLVPAYVANASAMVAGMLLKSKTPLDFGFLLPDGQPLLGKGKTWKGTLSGIIIGTLSALALFIAFPAEVFSVFPNYAFAGFLIAFGAIFGDIAGSFIKRRLLIKSGAPTPILDQLDFVVGAYLFLSVLFVPGYEEFIFVCVFTVVTHILTNYIAFRLGLKKVPW